MKARLYFNGAISKSCGVEDNWNKEDNGENGKIKVGKLRRKLSTKRGSGLGKCSEKSNQRRKESIKGYLAKLQEIVPCCRKDKRLSNLEVITSAIDYIRQLRETLGLPPCDPPVSENSLEHFGTLNNLSDQFSNTSESPQLCSSQQSEECSSIDSSPVLWTISVLMDDNQQFDNNDLEGSDLSVLISTPASRKKPGK